MANESLLTKLLNQSIESEQHFTLLNKLENDVQALVSNMAYTDFKTTIISLQRVENILVLYLPENEQTIKMRCMINAHIGNIKRDTGFISGSDGAIKYYKLSISLSKLINDRVSLSKLFLSLGACYEMQNKFLIAESLYKRSKSICSTLKYHEFLHSNSLTRIGCILTKMGEMNNAKKILNEAIEIREKDLVLNDSSFISQKLSIIDFKKGNFDRAFYDTEKMLYQSKTKSPLFNAQTLILLTDISLKSGEINTGLNYAVVAEQIILKNSLMHQLRSLQSIINQTVS